MIAIPAIDILENRIVRLKKGDYNQVTFYPSSPVEQVMLYESFGFKWTHIVDLAGSKDGKVYVEPLLKEIKSKTKMKIEFGGGIRNKETADLLFATGVDRIIIGSLAVKNKPEFEKIAASQPGNRFVAAVDIKDGMVAVTGWLENSGVTVSEHIGYCISLGINTFLCTDVSKDGMLTGLNFYLYEKIMNEFPGIDLIASGGVKNIEDIKETARRNIYGAVIGKAIYENGIDLKELSEIGK
jgi:phosphoribosylformimino-5-aminoimidazole carboxamide ribotide isomerase